MDSHHGMYPNKELKYTRFAERNEKNIISDMFNPNT